MARTKDSVSLILMIACCLFPALVSAEGISRASLLANPCFTCHGVDGEGALKIPKLKGMDRADLAATMNGFKAGTEKSTIMNRHAESYTDEEITLLAEYFAKLK